MSEPAAGRAGVAHQGSISNTMRRTWRFLSVFLLAVLALLLAAAALLYTTVPLANTQRARFDAIIVLGSPANPDGSASPVERARVMEGLREYRSGVAPALIMTGGAAHTERVEADAMGDFAQSQGVPATAILREKQAHNTIENAYYSVRMMQALGWKSAEVVSSRSHLPRASLIFAHFPIEYKMHGAPRSPEIGWLYDSATFVYEARNTNYIRLFGFRPNRYLP